jgi:hypothetical protein
VTAALDDLVGLYAAQLRLNGVPVGPAATGQRELHVVYGGDEPTLVWPGTLRMALRTALGLGPGYPLRISRYEVGAVYLGMVSHPLKTVTMVPTSVSMVENRTGRQVVASTTNSVPSGVAAR